MMTKTKLNTRSIKLYSTIIVMVVLACSCQNKKTGNLQPMVFAVGGGFGYSISLHGKLLIKQEAIPAIDGNMPFCDSLDAVKVSALVVQKLKVKQSPAVTREELATLKIKIKC